MTVIEASVNIFNNKTGRLKNEKVSMTSKMVQNKKVHNKIYRKKGENPILLIPGSKSSTLSRSVTNLKSQYSGRSRIHPRSVAKYIDCQSQQECPYHKDITANSRIVLQNKIDKKERSGIPVDMHMIQHQHLQQYQSDKPLYSL
jgi:hypothetical protein